MTPALLTPENRIHADPDPDTLAAVLAFTAPALTTTTPVPEAFTPEWFVLDDADPRRQFGLIRSALSDWSAKMFGSGVPADVIDREVERRMNAAAKDMRAGVRWSPDRRRWLPVDNGRAAA
ncbi:MAG: hypothetical protein J2P27_01055 [Actinobacteria bacterium]|nr:hypothetical protein [Actinomycetota bacterium]